MKLFLIIASYLFCTSSFALSTLPSELKNKENWNADYLEKLYQGASEAISPLDFEEYKHIYRKQLPIEYLSTEYIPNERLYWTSELNTLPQDYLYANTCKNYLVGDESWNEENSDWWISNARLFRFTSQQSKKLDELTNKNNNVKEFLFSGAFHVDPEDLFDVSKVFVSEIKPTEINLKVLPNSHNIYSDFGDDLSVNFRKTKGVLISKIERGNNVLAYKVCYKKEVVYCSAQAAQDYLFYPYYKNDVIPKKFTKVINHIFVAHNKEAAIKLFQNTYEENCSSKSKSFLQFVENFIDGPTPISEVKSIFNEPQERIAKCKVAIKALKNMICTNDFKSLKIKHADFYTKELKPIDINKDLNFWD